MFVRRNNQCITQRISKYIQTSLTVGSLKLVSYNAYPIKTIDSLILGIELVHCIHLVSHPGLNSTVLRYCPLWAPTTPSRFVSRNSHENFLLGHPLWDCSRVNSLNFGVPMEPEASELPKGLVLGRDGNIHIKLTGSTPLDDVGYYI
ncbi:hypothetical protein DVH24_034050 [Malus domestica]|uniref:Uncharacterized protein n=1 Tax=Malus domestica TaxID=3750 RepID=A0A498KWY5_MALDO|nr:hypothetical protein DVH24_034050 [Malus domestica]